jgi:ketosteroid isomerase-like protein
MQLRASAIQYVPDWVFFLCIHVFAEGARQLNSIWQYWQRRGKHTYVFAAFFAWKPTSEINGHTPCN